MSTTSSQVSRLYSIPVSQSVFSPSQSPKIFFFHLSRIGWQFLMIHYH